MKIRKALCFFVPLVLHLPSAVAAEGDDPFAIFEEKAKKSASDSSSKQSSTQNRPPPPSVSSGEIMELYCWGNINRYTGENVMETIPFEFITVANKGEKSHAPKTVTKGPILRQGATYGLTPVNSQMMVLSAESTRSEISLPSLQLNLATSALTGSGTVNMSEARSRLAQRLEARGMNTRGSTLLQRGLDSKRRAEVDGYCQEVE